jgi:hypothetical protein
MSEPTHHSYLLRLWREHARAPLRATLIEVAQPEQRRHFADLDALCAFLLAQAHPAGLAANQTPDQTAKRDADHRTPDDPRWEDPPGT